MTFSPAPPLDILLHGLVGVDYILHLSAPLSPSIAESSTRFGARHEIEREERIAGSLMWRVAQSLFDAKVRVALSGNLLGDDSNGRLVERENQGRDWLLSKRASSVETPYRVLLQTPDAPTVVLSRCQAALQHDHKEFAEESSTRYATWPRAKLICCSDELPFSTLSLARFAQTERIPLYVVSTGNVSIDEQARAATKELHSLAASVVALQSGDVRELAAQLCVALRLLEHDSDDRTEAE